MFKMKADKKNLMWIIRDFMDGLKQWCFLCSYMWEDLRVFIWKHCRNSKKTRQARLYVLQALLSVILFNAVCLAKYSSITHSMVVQEIMIDMIAQPPVSMKAPAPPALRMASWQSHGRLRPQPISMKRCMLLGKFFVNENFSDVAWIYFLSFLLDTQTFLILLLKLDILSFWKNLLLM